MKLLVIGTSNSILRGGYADALREDARVQQFLRIGPGGSTSIILPYFGQDLDFGAFDRVIIDTSINDSAFLGWGLIRAADIRENLDWILPRAINAGCGPIILCLPNRTRMNGDEDAALPVYRQAARDYAVPLLNGYEFVAGHAAEQGQPVADLFSDDLHLQPAVARHLAPLLLDLCDRIPEPGTRPETVSFRRLEAGQIDLPRQYRRTSLTGADCAMLAPETNVPIRLAAHESLVGVAYNAGKSFGSLIIRGADTVAINVRSEYYAKHDLVVAARQISPAVAPRDGIVQMHMQDKSGSGAEIIGLLIRGA